MDLPYSVDELRKATHELLAANGLPAVLHPPDRVLRLRRARRRGDGQPVDVIIMSYPWGAYLGEEGQQHRDHDDDLELGAGRPERDPARREGDRDLPELDARDHRGAPRRIRRGDHAHPRRLRRRRPRREHLRRQGRPAPDAASLDVDPPGDHARHDHPSRARARLHGGGDAAHPDRSLPRRRGLHGRHGDRGSAGPLRRRTSEIGVGPDHARAAEDVPGRRERAGRALERLARRRRDGARAAEV